MTRQRKIYICNNNACDLKLTKQECQSVGAFHTPRKFALEMAKKLFPKYTTRRSKCETKAELIEKFGQEAVDLLKDFRLIDPCCGTGNLLAAAMNVYKWIDEEDIYGVDIDPRAVDFCMRKFPRGHFQVGDCLLEDLTDDKFWEHPSDGLFGAYKAQKLAEATKVIKDKSVKNRQQISAELLQQKQMQMTHNPRGAK